MPNLYLYFFPRCLSLIVESFLTMILCSIKKKKKQSPEKTPLRGAWGNKKIIQELLQKVTKRKRERGRDREERDTRTQNECPCQSIPGLKGQPTPPRQECGWHSCPPLPFNAILYDESALGIGAGREKGLRGEWGREKKLIRESDGQDTSPKHSQRKPFVRIQNNLILQCLKRIIPNEGQVK